MKSGVGILDKLLVPRVESYASNNSLLDIDEVAEYLRKNYKEYQRKQYAPFRQMVQRAIENVRRRGVFKTELSLQALEERHLANRTPSRSQPGESSGPARLSRIPTMESPESSEPELDSEGAAAIATSGLNSSLVAMYAKSTPEQGVEGVRPDGQTTPPPIFAGSLVPGPMVQICPPSTSAAGAPREGKDRIRRTSDVKLPAKQVPLAPTPLLPKGATLQATPLTSRRPLPDTVVGGSVLDKRLRSMEDTGGRSDRRQSARQVRRRGLDGAEAMGRGLDDGRRSSAATQPRPLRYADLGGIEPILADVRELIEYPLKHPEVYAWLGVAPPRGVLLHGPPGCGKTALAHAIANEVGVPFLRVAAPEIVSGMSGESEAKVRDLFNEARQMAPCIVFIDEIDAICPKRETAQREMERRIVAQMLTCMDDLSGGDEAEEGAEDLDCVSAHTAHVVVIGATNRPDSLDPALRRAGRFDREISLGIPTEAGRIKILNVLTRRLRLAGDFDFAAVARRTPGFVGADLQALTKEAAAVAVTRAFSAIESQAKEAAAEKDIVPVVPMSGYGVDKQVDDIMHSEEGPGLPKETSTSGEAGGQMVVDIQRLLGEAAAVEGDHTGVDLHGEMMHMDVDFEGALSIDRHVDNTAALQEPPQANGHLEIPLPPSTLHTRLVGPSGPETQKETQSRVGAGPLTLHELRGLAITMADFEVALPKVQPSVRREGFSTKPDVTWDDVGALTEVREELSFAISQPIAHPERFTALGLSVRGGVLLYGPPGCGKTLLAKAVAAESGANFISIKGPELLNKYVGESERAVRQLFTRARAAQPCVLFFDELDALAPRRGNDTNQAAERVVNQLLTEMDGSEGREGVYIIGATNRPDMIDPALLRPGRLDKLLFVELPNPGGRADILNALTRKTPLGEDVDLKQIAAHPACEGLSGADLAALVREACVNVIKESFSSTITTGSTVAVPAVTTAAAAPTGTTPPLRVMARHFSAALRTVEPSVSRKDQKVYDSLRHKLRRVRGHLVQEAEVLGFEEGNAAAVDKPVDDKTAA